MTEEQKVFYHLGAALAIGLLIGVERGWKERTAEEGKRIAGVRTYGLIGLLGGTMALLAHHFGELALGLGFIGVAAAMTVVYVANLRRDNDVGITGLVSAMLTFVLGALAGVGEVAVAGAFGVVMAILLTYKAELHSWVRALEAGELQAGMKLLMISVVLLPVLPNQGYGPWGALNPYAIWWMVVLIATISFVGYFAVKIGGARRGTVFTGIFGGLASSTALTLHFSRMSRATPEMAPVLGLGILLACGTMLPRLLLISVLLNPQLLKPLLLPIIVMALLIYVPALLYWYQQPGIEAKNTAMLKNPLELKFALFFASLLALVLLLGRALRDWFGEAGVLVLAGVSGIADADAATLSLARMSSIDLDVKIATTGIVLAAAVNSLAKATMATMIGGREVGLRVALPLLASAAAGVGIVYVLLR